MKFIQSWASEGFFPVGGLRDFSKIFPGGDRSGEIGFSHSKLKKTTFLLKISKSKIRFRLSWMQYIFCLCQRRKYMVNDFSALLLVYIQTLYLQCYCDVWQCKFLINAVIRLPRVPDEKMSCGGAVRSSLPVKTRCLINYFMIRKNYFVPSHTMYESRKCQNSAPHSLATLLTLTFRNTIDFSDFFTAMPSTSHMLLNGW